MIRKARSTSCKTAPRIGLRHAVLIAAWALSAHFLRADIATLIGALS